MGSHAYPVLSVVIPAYCEGPSIARSIAAVTAVLHEMDVRYELILVDDGSTDDTWYYIERAADEHPEVRAIRFGRNFGKEAAMFAGFDCALGNAVVVMDADLQHPPQLLPELYRVWAAGEAEVVEAVKTRRANEPVKNRVGSKLFYFLMNRLSGFDLTGASDFKLMDRSVVDALVQLEERNFFFRGMIAWLGFRRVQIPLIVPERIEGRSKWTLGKLTSLFAHAITSFSMLPLQLITLAGLCFLGFSVVLGGTVLWQWFTGEAVEGFTTVILLLEIIGSLLMLSLGIIGTYLARIYEEVKRRPRYVVTQVRSGLPPVGGHAAYVFHRPGRRTVDGAGA